MITKSGINTKDFEFNSAGEVCEDLYMSYTAKEPTKLFVLTNKNGMEVCITNVGARIVSIMAQDKFGQFRDVVVGCSTLKDYIGYELRHDNFFGALVGRYANRIGHAHFEIDGHDYSLPVNNAPNCLHGGHYGWAYQSFKPVEYDDNLATLRLHLSSPDGDMGFPGNVEFDVCYHLTDNNALEVSYSATTDKATPINVTNHSYFNLEGNPSHTVLNDRVFLCAIHATELGKNMLPTGKICDIEKGSALDFFGKRTFFGPSYLKQGKRLGQDIYSDDEQIKLGNGYDHNFVLLTIEQAKNFGISPYKDKIAYCAKCHNEISGITMNVFTTQPGVQLYDSVDCNFSITGKNNIPMGPYCGVCFETQNFPDAPNHQNFPNSILRSGEEFNSTSVYQFS